MVLIKSTVRRLGLAFEIVTTQHPACLRLGLSHYSHLKVKIRKCGVNVNEMHYQEAVSMLRVTLVGVPVWFLFLVE